VPIVEEYRRSGSTNPNPMPPKSAPTQSAKFSQEGFLNALVDFVVADDQIYTIFKLSCAILTQE